MIHTVLFDLGGTLEEISSDRERELAAARETLRILARNGLDPRLTEEEAAARMAEGRRRYGAFCEPTCRELKPEEIWEDYILTGFGLPSGAVRPFGEELSQMWETTYFRRALRPRVREMLEGLRGLRLRLGVISNTTSLFQPFRTLEGYGIRDYFQDITLSSVTGYRKPDPNIFRISLWQMRARPEECAYVGDTLSRDVAGPQRMGFAMTIQINSYLTSRKDRDVPPEVRPDYHIEDIYEVYPILRQALQ